MKKRKKGFTLIELLAVIVILAIIALIAVPVILNIIDKANKSSFKDTAYGVIQAGELYFAEKQLDLEGMSEDVTIELPDTTNTLGLKGNVPNGSITITTDGKISVTLKNERYCVTKGLDDKDITISENLDDCKEETLYVDTVLNGADPVLREGMIPVIISANGQVTKADRSQEWYNYTSKQWANAVLVDNDSRENYKTMDAGEPISESDILAYFVWIPRYKYKLWYTEAVDGSTALDTSKVHSINIVFENKDTAKSDGTCNGEKDGPSNGCYLTHPAFTFGEELNGIWVGKFETGYNGATTTTEAQVETIDSSKVIIKPNTYSWRYNTVSNMFYTALNMNSDETLFGLKTDSDTHMMKNTEWGAVTYLAFSDYGKVSEVYLNNNSNYLTGCGADAVTDSESSSCINGYGTKSDNVYNQSTTGNVSGIFDMSGGAYEYVMGYTTGANISYGSSGFTTETFPEDKYIDIYTSTSDTQYSKRILGDATGEMGPFASYIGSWYNDYANFANSHSPWFMRGGNFGDSSDTGLAYFDRTSGTGYNDDCSFRAVLT